MSTAAGSGSYSILTRATASSATARVSATTAATASPAHVARSSGRGSCGADFMPFKWASTATHGSQCLARSAPVNRRTTPGIAIASAPSILRILACGCGLLTNATCTMRGSTMSSTNWPRPSTSFFAFGRGIDLPM